MSRISWIHSQNASIHPRTDNLSPPEQGCSFNEIFRGAFVSKEQGNWQLLNSVEFQQDTRNENWYQQCFIDTWKKIQAVYPFKDNKSFCAKDFWKTRRSKRKLLNPQIVFESVLCQNIFSKKNGFVSRDPKNMRHKLLKTLEQKTIKYSFEGQKTYWNTKRAKI